MEEKTNLPRSRAELDGMIAENERIIRLVKNAVSNPDTYQVTSKTALMLLVLTLENDLSVLQKIGDSIASDS